MITSTLSALLHAAGAESVASGSTAGAPAMAGDSSMTSSTPFAVAVLVVFFVVLWLWRKLMRATSRKVNQKVLFRGSHQEGQRAVRQGLTLSAPVGAAPALDAVVTAVNAYDKPPAMVGGLYLEGRDSQQVIFTFGSKLGSSFRTRVQLTDTTSGCSGRFQVLSWTETEGLVSAREQIDRVRDRVAGAVRALGGDVLVTDPTQQSDRV